MLSKSEFIPAEIYTDKNTNMLKIKSKYAKNNGIIKKLTNYSIEICKNAISEINHNYIKPKPIKHGYMRSSCSYCPYNSICKFNINTDGFRERLSVTIDNEGDK
jgi:ATP-dependent helicase/DNAse subunit B